MLKPALRAGFISLLSTTGKLPGSSVRGTANYRRCDYRIVTNASKAAMGKLRRELAAAPLGAFS
jgi:hypothetical protein